MPIYEFRCHNCGEYFEDLVMSRNSIDAVLCKKCGSANIERLMSGAAIKSSHGANHECSGSEHDCPVKMGGTCCGGGHCHHS